MIDGKTPPSLSPTVPSMGGHEGSELGVGSVGGSAVSSSGAGGTARMSVVPRNPPAAVPGNGDTPSRKPVRLCQVCGDIAKSLHFGGLSCDSCKAFFRRSVQNDAYKHFRCGGDQKCAISIASRKFCKYCRFAKCESIGMTKSWVMSEDERLQLMKTRLTKRMMYNQGGNGSVSSNGGTCSPGGQVDRGINTGTVRPTNSFSPDCPKDSSHYQNTTPKTLVVTRIQTNHSSTLTYHPPSQPVDLGSTGSSPNSSPSTPISGPLTPIQYGPIPPPHVHHGSDMANRQLISPKQENSPVRTLCRGIKRENEEEIVPVERVFNPASQYLDANEVEIVTRLISNIKLVDHQLPYSTNKPTEVMATYSRFAERVTRFLRQYDEFNSLSQQSQLMATQKNITVIALVFASSFLDEETGNYNNLHSPSHPMITNMNMIQKSQSPEVFSKFKEIMGSLRQFNVDSRMAYMIVLHIVVEGGHGLERKKMYQTTLQHYSYWKFGEASGKALIDGLIRNLNEIRRHAALFENMSLPQARPSAASAAAMSLSHLQAQRNATDDMDVKSRVEAMIGEQIRHLLNGMDIEQMKQVLQGNGLEQMKQMLQSMECENSTLAQDANALLQSVHSPPLPSQSPHNMVQSPQSMVHSPHSMMPSPHNMLQSPQSMLSPQAMMESSHTIVQPSSSPGVLQSPTMSQSVHTVLDISHSMSHSPNSTVTQIINASNSLLNYQDMKPPGSFMNSPQSLDLSQSPIEMSSPSPHAMNLTPSPAPYIPNQESYILETQIADPPYPDHRQSPLDEGGYLNPPLYQQAPYSPAPPNDQFSSAFQTLFAPSPIHFKEENQSISNSSNGSSGVGVSLTSPMSSLITSPAPSHSSLQESDSSLSNYKEPEHGNSLGAAP